ncbi:metallopeptidase TldD-related protein [Haloimpatiens massiliensis]|uniref:metallopeptidase TldD-related protein n=1 Tax=Haloimpatiens massiliensis TaxID=1658110 RepID=UPI000C81DDA7|nr:metallopeptidase TldD-related protein [Haloimpatiens massiliensis]
MITIIKNILSAKDISGYKIIESITESVELFFIKKELHMDRSKKVHYFNVTVYKNFEEDGKKFTGSSTCNVYPTMTEKEIDHILEDAAYSASLIKNEFYPLPKASGKISDMMVSSFASHELSYWIPKLTDAIFKYDNHEKGCINSCELFLNKIYNRIVNSEGIDVNYEQYKGELEFIVNWKESGEEIELYKFIKFSDFDEKFISGNIKEMLELAREKAIATTTVKSGKYTLLLTGSPVKELFSYYFARSNVSAVYDQISQWKINQKIQGENIKGDAITMVLNPKMKNSIFSVPYDQDGVALDKVTIIENGVLNNYHGSNRYSYYLNQPTTGSINNMEFLGGSKTIEDLKKSPYIELVSFSDFQLNPLTGDFGGEIRLGWYFDGEKTIPITGGSLSGNINEVHKEMYLSKELQQFNGFIGPKTVQMFDLTVAGIQ